MSEFSSAQFEAVVNDITGGLGDLAEKLNQVMPAAESAVNHWWIEPHVRDIVLWIGRETVRIGRELLETFKELIEGIYAPLVMFLRAGDWVDGVKGPAARATSLMALGQINLTDSVWEGGAKDSFLAMASLNADAASRITDIADGVSSGLTASAVAGFVFYAALLALLVKLVIAAVAAVAAMGSGVFSWAGAALFVEEAAIDGTAIAVAVGVVTELLVQQAATLSSYHSLAIDTRAFPRGRWPAPEGGWDVRA